MAFQMSRIDKRQRTYTVADNLGGTYTTVDVALLPVGRGPTAATVWTSVPYSAGVATVVWAGPDADSTGAIVVPASADMWIKGTNAPYVQAIKDERITVLGGGAPLAVPTGIPVISVNGHQGATLDLSDQFVTTSGTSGVHVDTTRAVNAAQRWMQEVINVTITGDLILTLGAPPIGGKVALWVKSGSTSPARLLPSGYSVVGSTVTILALTAGNTVLLEYFYDSDVTASPAGSASNQYDLWDDFERTVGATSSGAALGAAITGQVPAVFGTGTWAIDSGNLHKQVAGGTAAQDCVYWPTSSANGWLETVYSASSTSAAVAGLAVRGNTSTTRIHTLNNGMSVRTSATDVRQFTSSQTLVAGDGVGVLMTGANFKLHRRVANAGPWLYIGEFTLATATSDANPTLLTSTSHGVRNANTVSTDTLFTYLKFIAGATTPPVVS